MAQLTRLDLHAEIDGRFPNNTTELITPPVVRAFLHNLVESALLVASDKVSLSQAHTLAFVQNLLATAPDLVPGLRYDIAGDWNGTGDPDQVVYVQAATATTFEAYGTLESGPYPGRVRALVQVDVVAGTAVPPASPPSGGRNTGPYKPGSDYNQYDLVTYRGLSYYAGEDTSGVGAFDPTDWRVFGPDPAVVAANTAAIGVLASLGTTAKTDLVAAVNELVTVLATKAGVDDLPLDWLWSTNITSQHTAGNPAQLAAKTLTRLNPYAEPTTDFYVSLPPAWYAKGVAGTTLAIHALTAGTLHFVGGFLVDKANTLTLTAGTTVVLSATAEGRSTKVATSGVDYTVVLRTGAGASAATGDVTTAQLEAVRTTLELRPAAGGNYTLALADAGRVLPVSSAAGVGVEVQVPAQADVPFAIGTIVFIRRMGAGSVHLGAAAGVTVRVPAGADYYVAAGDEVSLHKEDVNTWFLKGGVSA
ncbi:hypothetical protein [Hymenobacter cheonanensis]|uniref:hypothetical protein n=1 Tax=Hymenobacter sp. CA2-7 TaxID=3063993 RepID=UPI002713E2E1|nr:hypothetical protein [Hymenobacter sp. CA2-7]MDO7885342.1 hypothetical protein [Hymenobacter sp. CA2-7]